MELETRIILSRTYVKVIINQKGHNTGKATKIAIRVGQVINNCKVKKDLNEVWIPNHCWHNSDGYQPINKYIWVEKEFYDKMRFV